MRIIISLLISIICSAVSFAQQQAVGLYMINGDTETAMTPIKYKNIKISGTFSKTARLEFALMLKAKTDLQELQNSNSSLAQSTHITR